MLACVLIDAAVLSPNKLLSHAVEPEYSVLVDVDCAMLES